MFRSRCLAADQRAYSRFELPHISGGAPADDEQEEEDVDVGEDVAEADRRSLAAYPAPYVWTWSKLNGVKGKLPDPQVSATASRFTVFVDCLTRDETRRRLCTTARTSLMC